MFLNKASRYGLYAATMMATRPDERVSARAIAEAFDISEHHVAKVLQQLSRARLVDSVRGVGGGYQLARPAERITMLEIVETLDGPLTQPCSTCSLRHSESCRTRNVACAVHSVLGELNMNAWSTLKSVTISALAQDATFEPQAPPSEMGAGEPAV